MRPRLASSLALLALVAVVNPRSARGQTSAPLPPPSAALALPPQPPPPPAPSAKATESAAPVPTAAPLPPAPAQPPPAPMIVPPAPSPIAAPPAAPPAPTARSAPSEVPKAWQYAPPIAPKMVKDTYSGHIVLADGVSLAMIFLGAQTQAEALVGAGVVGYFLGGPIVHSGHGRGKTSAASLGLRVLGPLATGAVGAGVFQIAYGRGGSDGDDYAAVVGFAVGGAIGLVVSPILDATVLARTEWFNDLPLVPQVSLGPKGGSVGLAGVF